MKSLLRCGSGTRIELLNEDRALQVEAAQGQIGAYEIAFADPDSIIIGTRTVRGIHLGFVYRQHGAVYFSSLMVYTIGDAILKVRATVPHSQLPTYDVPEFAHALVKAQSLPHGREPRRNP